MTCLCSSQGTRESVIGGIGSDVYLYLVGLFVKMLLGKLAVHSLRSGGQVLLAEIFKEKCFAEIFQGEMFVHGYAMWSVGLAHQMRSIEGNLPDRLTHANTCLADRHALHVRQPVP